ncbi:hypothetical protein DL93DRAFT_2086905 [Clavulina sp. PMI_390]|nr:hypothetical protein DL93DRAFT_2086905 [Clavulina sp. PMI_390]
MEDLDVKALIKLATRTYRDIIIPTPSSSSLTKGSLIALTLCDSTRDSISDHANLILASDIIETYLLRGGRWAIGIRENDSRTEKSILCWDTLAQDEDSFCYAVTQLLVSDILPSRDDYEHLKIAALDYSAGLNCIHILLLDQNITSDIAVISLALDPRSGPSTPMFTSIRSTSYPSWTESIEMNGDWVMQVSSDLIMLWNWKKNTFFQYFHDPDVESKYFLFPDGLLVAHHEKIYQNILGHTIFIVLFTLRPCALDGSNSVADPAEVIASPTVTLRLPVPYDLSQYNLTSHHGALSRVGGEYVLPLLLGNIAHVFVAMSPQGEFRVSDVQWFQNRSLLPRLAHELTTALWDNYSKIEIEKRVNSGQLEVWISGIEAHTPAFVRRRRLCAVSWMPSSLQPPQFQVRGLCVISGTFGFVERSSELPLFILRLD